MLRASGARRASDVVVDNEISEVLAAISFGAPVEQFRALVEEHLTRSKRDFMAAIGVVLNEQGPGPFCLLGDIHEHARPVTLISFPVRLDHRAVEVSTDVGGRYRDGEVADPRLDQGLQAE